jgi:hypothetical protein
MIPIHYTATFSDSDERFHGDLKINIDFETDAEIAEFIEKQRETVIRYAREYMVAKCPQWHKEPKDCTMLEVYYHSLSGEEIMIKKFEK